MGGTVKEIKRNTTVTHSLHIHKARNLYDNCMYKRGISMITAITVNKANNTDRINLVVQFFKICQI